MADALFYMRVRGKISGPFDIATLQKLVRRGTLSRIHEISSDRSAWNAAGQYEDLFPSAPAPSAQPVAAVADAPVGNESAVKTATASGQILYYYTQRGSTVGPVPFSVLKTLVENGTLRKDDLVWRENSDTGAPAVQMPMLAPIFAGQNSSPQPTRRLEPAAMWGRALLAGGGLLLVLFIGVVAWWYIGPKLGQPKQAASSTSIPFAPDAGEELRKNDVGMVVIMVTYYAAAADNKLIKFDVPIGTGTAFAIGSDGKMVTNARVANAGDHTQVPDPIDIKELSPEPFHRRGDPYLKVCFGPDFKDQFVAKATVVDDQIDLAFLQIDHKFAHPLKFANAPVHQASRVSACGFPGVVTDFLNATHEWTPDQLDKIRRKLKNASYFCELDGYNPSIFENILTEGVVGNAHADVDGQTYIEFSAKVAHGNSGGPLLNSENEVVGVVSFGMKKNGNAEAEGYNYAIPASVVQDELKALSNKQ